MNRSCARVILSAASTGLQQNAILLRDGSEKGRNVRFAEKNLLYLNWIHPMPGTICTLEWI